MVPVFSCVQLVNQLAASWSFKAQELKIPLLWLTLTTNPWNQAQRALKSLSSSLLQAWLHCLQSQEELRLYVSTDAFSVGLPASMLKNIIPIAKLGIIIFGY